MSKVKSVISYVDMVGETIPTSFLDESDLKKLNSDNYTRMIVSVDADFEGEDTYKLIDDIKAAISKYYGEYYLLGEGVSTYDLKNTVTADMTTVNIIAIAAVFIVLLLTEKSLSLPILLVAAIETAIYINMSVPYYRSSSVFYIAYLIISSIQLGATVDYAILLSERYLEERKSLNKADAAINTVSMTAVSILTSATAMIVVGILLGKFSTHGLISQLGYLLAIGTTASLVIVLFVLPGLLYSLDGLIQKTTKNTEFVN
ncbi:MMPL family transporter [Fenollaria timonensis]